MKLIPSLFTLMILLIAGCATQKTVIQEEVPKAIEIDESFDLTTLEEKDIKIKTSHSTDVKSDFDATLLNQFANDKSLEEEIDGYRVQICAVSDEFKAREIQKEAILKFNENVYLIYNSPYYKVRVGNCATRYNADQLQKFAEEKGFADAWVVKTRVKPKPENEQKDIDIPGK